MQDRVCVGHVNSEMGFSGGEVQVFLLMEGLRALGHRVTLFSPPGSRSVQEAAQRGIDCVPIRMLNDFDWPAVISLVRSFRRSGVELVHLHTGRANWLGGLAGRAARLPAITTRRMDRAVKRNWRTRLIYGCFVQRAVAISPAVQGCLIAGGVPPEQTHLIYEAVDPARVQSSADREATRAALGAGPQEVVLLTVAALIRRKGIDVLLEALALLGEQGERPRLWVAGEGPERELLQAQVARLDLGRQVRFLGERRDTADLLAGCDVFVLPSRREGLGVSALEAMGAARPVVCSSVGGLRDSVIEGRTGLLVGADDPAALARALLQVVRDQALQARLGRAGPGRVAEGFLAEQMVDAHRRLYEEVLREWRRGRSHKSEPS